MKTKYCHLTKTCICLASLPITVGLVLILNSSRRMPEPWEDFTGFSGLSGNQVHRYTRQGGRHRQVRRHPPPPQFPRNLYGFSLGSLLCTLCILLALFSFSPSSLPRLRLPFYPLLLGPSEPTHIRIHPLGQCVQGARAYYRCRSEELIARGQKVIHLHIS